MGDAKTVTCGNDWRTNSTVPSPELSITRISVRHRSEALRIAFRQPAIVARPL
jgi:hypothetical protein